MVSLPPLQHLKKKNTNTNHHMHRYPTDFVRQGCVQPQVEDHKWYIKVENIYIAGPVDKPKDCIWTGGGGRKTWSSISCISLEFIAFGKRELKPLTAYNTRLESLLVLCYYCRSTSFPARIKIAHFCHCHAIASSNAAALTEVLLSPGVNKAL